MRGETHLFRALQMHARRPLCHRARRKAVQWVLLGALRAGPCNRPDVLPLRCPFPTMTLTRRNR